MATGKNQQAIVQWLDSQANPDEWFTAGQIAKGTGLRVGIVIPALMGLKKRRIIDREYNDQGWVYNRQAFIRDLGNRVDDDIPF